MKTTLKLTFVFAFCLLPFALEAQPVKRISSFTRETWTNTTAAAYRDKLGVTSAGSQTNLTYLHGSGGSFKIDSNGAGFNSVIHGTNGLASRATNAAVAIATTGWTNSFSKQAIVRLDGTGVVYTVYNSAGTSIYTNAEAISHGIEILQPSGKLIISAGTGVSGTGAPF